MAATPDPLHQLPAPQAKLPGARPYKATRRPDLLPVPFVPFPVARSREPDFAPPPPSPGYFLWAQIPRVKLRGLGPADSIILRHAVARRLLDPATIYLAPLIPWTPPPLRDIDAAANRNLIQCPDAPLQPDAIIGRPYKMAQPFAPPEPEPAAPAAPPPTYPALPGLTVLEIKPNAGYVALGQVITYAWAWNRQFAPAWTIRPAILTDAARPYMPDLCQDVGVSLYALGAMLVEPPPWPT